MSQDHYQAVHVVAPGQLALTQKELRTPGPGEVRIRVEACGVCHTDVLTVAGAFPGLALPRVPGHEIVGRVDALGEGVTHLREGQRVGVGFLGGACLTCPSCRRGDFVNCPRQPFTGIHADGGYAEVVIARASGVAIVPDDLDATLAAPLLCAGLTSFNALRRSRALAGDLVAVQGLGGLGHLGVQYARQMGFRVAAIARGSAKASLAEELGADHYIDSTAEDPAAALQRLGGAKVIFATAADNASMSGLIEGLTARGELVVVGAGGDAMTVPAAPLLFGERRIVGANTGSTMDAEDTLAFSQLRGVRPGVEAVPLAEAPAAYARMLRNEARFRMVLTMGG